MDPYVLIMYSLSSFGFIIIFVSLYLLLTVPTKMTPLTRFVIHGHDFSSAFTQLYMTLGIIPSILLPCTSGYSNGFFTQFGIMSTKNQIWSLFAAVNVSSSFSLLLPINRSFAVSHTMNKWKKTILSIFFTQALSQVFVLPLVGVHLQDGGEKAKRACMKKITYPYPIEMHTLHGLNFISSDGAIVFLAITYTVLFIVIYVITSTVCGGILIRSVRNLRKTSQSAVFLACQRRITLGILYFIFLETVALGIPFICLAFCICSSIGSPIVAQLACCCVSIYPIFGSYYVLMSNADYRARVSSIIKRVYGGTARVESISVLSKSN